MIVLQDCAINRQAAILWKEPQCNSLRVRCCYFLLGCVHLGNHICLHLCLNDSTSNNIARDNDGASILKPRCQVINPTLQQPGGWLKI